MIIIQEVWIYIYTFCWKLSACIEFDFPCLYFLEIIILLEIEDINFMDMGKFNSRELQVSPFYSLYRY